MEANEVEIYKKALAKMSQRIGTLSLDLALAHAQVEELHAQLNEKAEEETE